MRGGSTRVDSAASSSLSPPTIIVPFDADRAPARCVGRITIGLNGTCLSIEAQPGHESFRLSRQRLIGTNINHTGMRPSARRHSEEVFRRAVNGEVTRTHMTVTEDGREQDYEALGCRMGDTVVVNIYELGEPRVTLQPDDMRPVVPQTIRFDPRLSGGDFAARFFVRPRDLMVLDARVKDHDELVVPVEQQVGVTLDSFLPPRVLADIGRQLDAIYRGADIPPVDSSCHIGGEWHSQTLRTSVHRDILYMDLYRATDS